MQFIFPGAFPVPRVLTAAAPADVETEAEADPVFSDLSAFQC